MLQYHESDWLKYKRNLAQILRETQKKMLRTGDMNFSVRQVEGKAPVNNQAQQTG
jgi:hypothetical protein